MSQSSQSSPERFQQDPTPTANSDPFADNAHPTHKPDTGRRSPHSEFIAQHPGAFESAPPGEVGAIKPSLVDRIVGEGAVLLGKATHNQEKIAAGEVRKAEGKAAVAGGGVKDGAFGA